jgi:outer membrane protein
MKNKFSFLSKITSCLAVSAVLVACNNNQPSKQPANAGTAEKAVSAEIVYVNSDTLLNKYQYFKDVSAVIEEKGKKAQSELASKAQAFDREVKEYQGKAGTLSADQRSATEERLARKQQELQSFNQNASAQLQNEQMEENEKLYDKIADFLKEHAKQKGYKLILTYSKANPTVLFGDESLNVTDEVVKLLNENYQKEKKK